MNIIERYVCAYIVECLTGIPGEYPEHVHSVLMESESNTQHPVLRQVLDLLKMGDLELGSDTARRLVREIVLDNAGKREPSPASVFESMANTPKYNGVLQRGGTGFGTVIVFKGEIPMEILGFSAKSEAKAIEYIKSWYPGINIKEA